MAPRRGGVKSKAIERIEERQSVLEPGTLRYETLEAAKRFKNSWVELGRMLWAVFRQKQFREWGYLSFEAYCSKEVGIRSATAKKLLNSYGFLEREEPAILEKISQELPPQIPSPEAVNLLRLLKAKPSVSQERYQKVRSYALEQGREMSDLRQEVRSVLESARPDSPESQQARHRARVRRMIGTLKLLKAELDESGAVPRPLLAQIGLLAKKLEEVVG